MAFVLHLICSKCSKVHEAGKAYNLCTECSGPLLVKYDIERLKASGWGLEDIKRGPQSMWRYKHLLPVSQEQNIVSLGEGMTPVRQLKRLGASLGCSRLWMKDDSSNPTGSFKARGMSCAISMCKELGIRSVAVPTAGNAGGASSAYAAAAGIQATVFMPMDTPQANFLEAKAYGADVVLVPGLIHDCGRLIGENKVKEGWFELSTLKEPYRIEGKKTMGLEIWEQFDQELPDAIFYPTGGGVGMIGMWKAFEELERLGWLKEGQKKPKMISVQATGCSPIVQAYEKGETVSQLFPNAHTVASGLRVPKALGDFLILRIVRESGGICVDVSDEEMVQAALQLGKTEGYFVAPEGGACLAALRRLLEVGFLRPDERILIYNTGTGYKYLEAYTPSFPRENQPHHASWLSHL